MLPFSINPHGNSWRLHEITERRDVLASQPPDNSEDGLIILSSPGSGHGWRLPRREGLFAGLQG